MPDVDDEEAAEVAARSLSATTKKSFFPSSAKQPQTTATTEKESDVRHHNYGNSSSIGITNKYKISSPASTYIWRKQLMICTFFMTIGDESPSSAEYI